MGKLHGKCAIITGAASGIGRASALRFSDDGAAVMCADIDLDGAQHTAAMIAERGRPGAAIKLDVGDSAAVEAALQATISELGGFDILFNNAGISGLGRTWADILRINLDGVYNGLFYGCRLLASGSARSSSPVLTGCWFPPTVRDLSVTRCRT